MTSLQRIVAVVLLVGGSSQAFGQSYAQPPGRVNAGTGPVRSAYRPPYPYDRTPYDQYVPGERSVLRRSPSYDTGSDMTWGFRNPGGVGRYKEYYPPGNRFQNENATQVVARFDQGPPGTTRQDQMQAVSIGTQRNQVLLNNYGRPYGYGYGYGYLWPYLPY
jgi:hypothetical protein